MVGCGTKRDFQNERHVIMQVVCETTQSTETQVKVAALQCLVKIMSLYYEHMEHYMGSALFAVRRPALHCRRRALHCFKITITAMKSSVEDECLQGIEFWSNVCEEEIELSVEAEDVRVPPAHLSTSRLL